MNNGTYSGFVTSDKSVSVVARVSGTVMINGSMYVKDLAAGKLVAISGLVTYIASGGGSPVVGLEYNVGAVRFRDCWLRGARNQRYLQRWSGAA